MRICSLWLSVVLKTWKNGCLLWPPKKILISPSFLFCFCLCASFWFFVVGLSVFVFPSNIKWTESKILSFVFEFYHNFFSNYYIKLLLLVLLVVCFALFFTTVKLVNHWNKVLNVSSLSFLSIYPFVFPLCQSLKKRARNLNPTGLWADSNAMIWVFYIIIIQIGLRAARTRNRFHAYARLQCFWPQGVSSARKGNSSERYGDIEKFK